MSAIKINDTVRDAIMKMSEGNPGALTVLLNLFQTEHLIDPDSALGGMGTIFMMDNAGIRGPAIWICYKDLCDENLVRMVALWRAAQLGFCSLGDVTFQIHRLQMGGVVTLDLDYLMKKVRQALPNFGHVPRVISDIIEHMRKELDDEPQA